MRKSNPLQKTLFKTDENESQIQKTILQVLKIKRCFTIRFNSGCFRIGKRFVRAYILPNGKSAGLPDIHFYTKDGRPHYIEVKRPGGIVRESQMEFIESIKPFNVPVMIADNWEQVLDYVNDL